MKKKKGEVGKEIKKRGKISCEGESPSPAPLSTRPLEEALLTTRPAPSLVTPTKFHPTSLFHLLCSIFLSFFPPISQQPRPAPHSKSATC